MIMLANKELRQKARSCGVPLWMLAVELGISEPTMTRRLRQELSVRDKEKLLAMVADIARRKEAEENEQNAEH